jgi:UDP-N-acetylmuramate dehydrogenase
MSSHCVEKKSMGPDLRSDLSASWTGAIHWDVAMADYCTLRAGGKAEALLVASSRSELEALMRWLWRNEVSWRVIGLGSNILLQSRGFGGVVIVLGGDFCAVDSVDDSAAGEQVAQVRVGAGCSVARLIGWCSRHEVSGMEFMVGIPGSVGGAVWMNAGAWDSEIGDSVETVSYIDPEGIMHDASREELDFSYRQLQLKEGTFNDSIIIETVLRLKPGKQKEIIMQCRRYLDRRRAKQPMGVASAGSFFKNPPGDSAGRLIDEAGLKGLRKGNAMVSVKHANFIVNTGQATADDIVELMREVQEKVYLHSGVMLEPEVHLL